MQLYTLFINDVPYSCEQSWYCGTFATPEGAKRAIPFAVEQLALWAESHCLNEEAKEIRNAKIDEISPREPDVLAKYVLEETTYFLSIVKSKLNEACFIDPL